MPEKQARPRKGRKKAPARGPEPAPALEEPANHVQATEPLNVVVRGILKRGWKKLLLGAAVLGLAVGGCAVVVSGSLGDPQGLDPSLIPTPTPPTTPLPTPTSTLATSTPEPVIVIATPTAAPPRPPHEIIPFNQQGYGEYRFYHMWEELTRCRYDYEDLLRSREAEILASLPPPTPAPEVEGEKPTPEPTPEPTPDQRPSDVEMEQDVILQLQDTARWLLERYELQECHEAMVFTATPGRTKWLLWAAGFRTPAGAAAVGEE